MWSCVENSFNVLSSENRIIREINFEEGSRRSNFFFTVEWKEAHLMGAFQWDMECKTWGCGTLEEGPTLFAQQKVTLCSTPPPTPQHSLSSSHGADEWTNEWHEGKEQRLRNVNRLAHPPEKNCCVGWRRAAKKDGNMKTPPSTPLFSRQQYPPPWTYWFFIRFYWARWNLDCTRFQLSFIGFYSFESNLLCNH